MQHLLQNPYICKVIDFFDKRSIDRKRYEDEYN